MGGSLGGLAPKQFPWPTTIGGSPNVSPLVSASPNQNYTAPAPGSPSQLDQPNPITQPSKPPLAPPNPVNPITNPVRINPGMSRSFYGM